MDLKMDQPSILRVVIWMIAAVNMVLAHYGVLFFIPSDFWAPIIADVVFLIWSAYVGYKNNYLSPRGKLQKQELIRRGLYRPNK
ncbi:phage holin [Fictibacillus nanhaiensis]|uniref:phage holin n=1 Tax=Fictibacillus nanhaiensis TaxID=742169 RepID=UPI003C1E279B